MMSGANRVIRSTSQSHPTSSLSLRAINPAMPPSELIVANALRYTIPAFFSVPTFAPDLKKIMIKYRKYDPPP